MENKAMVVASSKMNVFFFRVAIVKLRVAFVRG